MEGGKKLAAIVVLIVVIVGAVVIVKMRMGGPRMPQEVRQRPREKIDVESGVLITKTYGEWLKLRRKDGMYKNPETGKYTMVAPHMCGSCGEKIPSVVLPLPPGGLDDPGQREAYAGALREAQAAYICPKCNKPAYRGMRGLRGPR